MGHKVVKAAVNLERPVSPPFIPFWSLGIGNNAMNVVL